MIDDTRCRVCGVLLPIESKSTYVHTDECGYKRRLCRLCYGDLGIDSSGKTALQRDKEQIRKEKREARKK